MVTDWQGRCSRLVALLLPERSFKAGEFESLDGPAWDALEAEFRGAAKTDARIELAEQAIAAKQAAKTAALGKLTAAERAALGV